jgi:hypothetical protein
LFAGESPATLPECVGGRHGQRRAPSKADIRWTEIEALAIDGGGTVQEREGSRIAMALNGVRANFHRPRPKPTTKKGAVDAVRLFLTNAAVQP